MKRVCAAGGWARHLHAEEEGLLAVWAPAGAGPKQSARVCGVSGQRTGDSGHLLRFFCLPPPPGVLPSNPETGCHAGDLATGLTHHVLGSLHSPSEL